MQLKLKLIKLLLFSINLQKLKQGYIYKYKNQPNMEKSSHSIQLGLLSTEDISQIPQEGAFASCLFSYMSHSQISGTTSLQVRLQIRGDYVLQIDPKQKNIISGFKCDYNINFEVHRSSSSAPMTLGIPQSLEFILNQNKKVRLLVQNAQQLQSFIKILEKKYIVQVGFHESFKAIKILGKGLTATVYKATRFRDKKDVAIKSFKRKSIGATDNEKLSFQKQFQILTKISHKNLCSFESVYETTNTTYIVMENLALSLFGWLQKYGFPGIQQVRKILSQLLKGIQYLHSKGIMHRDLKLQNIMVRKDLKQNTEIVIVDLGLAQFTNSQKFIYTRCGTPGYVAPEILKHKNQSQNYNQSCDIFSLGVIFHILLFKKSVFEGTQVKQVIKKNTECNVDFNSEYMSSICPQGIDLLKKMLQKQPSKRITAKEALNHQFVKPISGNDVPIKLDSTFLTLNSIVNNVNNII